MCFDDEIVCRRVPQLHISFKLIFNHQNDTAFNNCQTGLLYNYKIFAYKYYFKFVNIMSKCIENE